MLRSEVKWINELRRHELKLVLGRVPVGSCDLLELGGGNGQQAALLAAHGMRVRSIDIASSGYAEERLFPVQEYDGVHIPFVDGSFDVVFSSNTLEHVAALDAFQREIRRVLRPGGRAIHVVPNHRWRAWTWMTHYPGIFVIAWRRLRERGPMVSVDRNRRERNRPASAFSSLLMKILVSPRHGERGNTITEYAYFHPRWWERHFRRSGWQVVEHFDVPLFYTGYSLTRRLSPIWLREAAARLLGGVTTCFVLQKGGGPSA